MSKRTDLPKQTKFLICPEANKKELYILHRQFPACLIWIKQETPVRFVVLDLYDDLENPEDILEMEFVQAAKDFYFSLAENSLDKN